MVSDAGASWPPRMMAPGETPALARLWLTAWRDGHAAVVPEGLVKHRTEASFAARLAEFGDRMRVAGPEGDPLGFCVIDGDELYQLFLDRRARGAGLARTLLADGEARMAAAGVETAWLDCAPGNDRAAAFYEKCGWRFRGDENVEVVTEEGPFKMKGWIYEKRLVAT